MIMVDLNNNTTIKDCLLHFIL